jgi:hypothetical protein
MSVHCNERKENPKRAWQRTGKIRSGKKKKTKPEVGRSDGKKRGIRAMESRMWKTIVRNK